MDIKLSIHFGEDKTKSILFSSKRKIKNVSSLNIQYKEFKQYIKGYKRNIFRLHSWRNNLWRIYGHTRLHKVNFRLRFLYREKFLDILLRRVLCNAMIQPFLDSACNAWYSNLNKNLKSRLQAAQNKCIRSCLKLGDRTSIKINEFEKNKSAADPW